MHGAAGFQIRIQVKNITFPVCAFFLIHKQIIPKNYTFVHEKMHLFPENILPQKKNACGVHTGLKQNVLKYLLPQKGSKGTMRITISKGTMRIEYIPVGERPVQETSRS